MSSLYSLLRRGWPDAHLIRSARRDSLERGHPSGDTHALQCAGRGLIRRLQLARVIRVAHQRQRLLARLVDQAALRRLRCHLYQKCFRAQPAHG